MMKYKVKSRIWIETEKGVFLGEGRIRLLKAIEKTGSLNKAAKHLEMSYKKAWKLMDAINTTGEEPVVIVNIGGKNGGGTVLTDYGKKAITTFENMNKACWAYLDEQENELMK